MDGIIVVNKEKNMSSHDVVYRLRKLLKTKKIGHCGTLDPMASGVLVCLVNKATKLSQFIVLDTKEYIASFKLGVATTTQDLEGEEVARKEYVNDIRESNLYNVFMKYLGKSIQTPSIYSAIKVNGKKLYEYARENKEVKIPQREITIYQLELLSFVEDVVTIKVLCSSGTYIRTLCYDIARDLGYPGVLTDLKRTKSGTFEIKDSYTLSDIEEGNYQILSGELAFANYDIIELDEEQLKDVKNGKALEINQESDFLVKYDNELIAVYQASIDGFAKMKRGLW